MFQKSRTQDVRNPNKVKYIFWVVDTTSSSNTTEFVSSQHEIGKKKSSRSQLEPRLHGGLITKEKQQNRGTKTMHTPTYHSCIKTCNLPYNQSLNWAWRADANSFFRLSSISSSWIFFWTSSRDACWKCRYNTLNSRKMCKYFILHNMLKNRLLKVIDNKIKRTNQTAGNNIGAIESIDLRMHLITLYSIHMPVITYLF